MLLIIENRNRAEISLGKVGWVSFSPSGGGGCMCAFVQNSNCCTVVVPGFCILVVTLSSINSNGIFEGRLLQVTKLAQTLLLNVELHDLACNNLCLHCL